MTTRNLLLDNNFYVIKRLLVILVFEAQRLLTTLVVPDMIIPIIDSM